MTPAVSMLHPFEGPAAHSMRRDGSIVPLPAIVAFQALCAGRGVGPGKRVLVNGASRPVGLFAVQIGRALGGRVTAVADRAPAGRLRALGAERVVDGEQADFTRLGARFDLIVDDLGDRPLACCRHALVGDGTYVLTGASAASWPGPRFRRRAVELLGALATDQELIAFEYEHAEEDVPFLLELEADGAITLSV